LLDKLVPPLAKVGLLVHPTTAPGDADIKEVLAAAQTLKCTIHIVEGSAERDLEAAFATLARLNFGALIAGGDPFLDSNRDKIISLAAWHAMPAIYAWREIVVAGGLISYGTNLAHNYRQAGIYVGRILKGETPADLPVLQPTTFELIINLKTANALGLTVPGSLLLRTDEIID